MKKRNYAGWKLISTSIAIVDAKPVFKSLSILEKEIAINSVDYLFFPKGICS